MVQAPRERRSPEELDRLAEQVAQLAYEQRLGPAAIASRLGLKRGARDATNLLERSRTLVAVRVTPLGHAPLLDEVLAHELEIGLSLRKAIVVVTDDDDAIAPDSTLDAEQEAITVGRHLHEALGQAAGSHLLAVAREGDNIAVCSGRGVGYTIESIEKLVEARNGVALPRPATVLSLAGGVYLEASTEEDGLQHIDNADYNADKLATALKSSPTLCCVRAYRPTRTSRDDTIALDAKHLIARDLPIDIALYGAGVIDRHHYIMRIKDPPQAGAIDHERDEVRAITAEPGAQAAIIDHCEHFYRSSETPQALEERVDRLVRNLNDKVVAVSPGRIAKAPQRVLVAGGRQKLPALLELTKPGWSGVRPTTLVTDSYTATQLLRAC